MNEIETKAIRLESAGERTIPLQPFLRGRTYQTVFARYWELIEQFQSWGYAVASIPANVIAAIPLRLMLRKPKGAQPRNIRTRSLPPSVRRRQSRAMVAGEDYEIVEVIDDHPAINLLKNPNDLQDGFELINKTVLYMLFTGSAYWEILRSPLGTPTGVFLLPSQFVSPVVREGSIQAYRVGLSNERHIDPQDVVHFKCPNLGTYQDPSGLIEGYGPIEAAWSAITANDLQHRFDLKWLRQFGRPPFAISTTEKAWSEETLRAYKEQLKSFLADEDNVDSPLVLFNDAKVLAIGQDTSSKGQISSGASNSRDMVIMEIAACCGVPPALLSFNQSQAGGIDLRSDGWFLQNCIVPLTTRIQERLNKTLLQAWAGEGLFYDFDDQPYNPEKEKQEARELFELGIIDRNECRTVFGYEPQPMPVVVNGGQQ